MALAITASAANFSIGQVSLSVTGASGALPVGSAVYDLTFSGSLSSWAGGTDGSIAAPTALYYLSGTPIVGYVSSSSRDWKDADQWFGRTITGLTVGHVYRVSAEVRVYSGPSTVLMYVGVVGKGDGEAVTVTKNSYSTLWYEFTATATSHDVRIRRTDGSSAGVYVRRVKVQRYSTEQTSSLSIVRSDANGKRFVRLAAGAGPNSSGAMTAIDYEAGFEYAFYRVIDAAGNQAYSNTVYPYADSTFEAGAAHLVAVGTSLVAVVERVDEFEAGLEYRETGSALEVIGRGDPVVTTRSQNVWTKRQGSMRLFARQESEVEAILAVYRGSRVVFLRTDGFAIKDMYHVASSIDVEPMFLRGDAPVGDESPGNSGWAYQVVVEFQEIGWPAGDLAEDTWTYADIVEDNLAYFDLSAYGTYAGMESP